MLEPAPDSASDPVTTPETDRAAGPTTLARSHACGGTHAGARVAVLAGAFVVGAGASMLFSVVPAIVRSLGMSEVQGGALIASGAFSLLLGTSYWGTRSDDWGRKPVLVLGLGSYGTAFLIFAALTELTVAGRLTPDQFFWTLLGARAVLLFLGAGVVPAAQAFLLDIAAADRRTAAIAVFGGVVGAGYAFGPAFGGLLTTAGMTIPLVAVALAAYLATIAIGWSALPRPAATRAAPIPNRRRLDRRIVSRLSIGLALYAMLACVQQIVGFFVQDRFALEPVAASVLTGYGLTAAALATVACQLLLVPAFPLRPRGWIVLGASICAGALLAICFAASPPVFLIGFALFGGGAGCAATGFMAHAIAAFDEEDKGRAAGLAAATQALGFTLGPIAGPLLYGLAPTIPFAASAAVCVVIAAGLMRRRTAG